MKRIFYLTLITLAPFFLKAQFVEPKPGNAVRQLDLRAIMASTVGIVPSTSNISPKIQAQVASGRTLFIDLAGNYFVHDSILINGIKNFTVVGGPGVTFYTDNNQIFHFGGGHSDNVTISHLSMISNRVDATDGIGGLISFNIYNNDSLTNSSIEYNYFSNPNTKYNGLKVLSEGPTSFIQGLEIHHNRFKGIGRMPIEFQNHNIDSIKARIRDCYIYLNNIDSCGTIQTSGAAVSGISLTGYQEHVDIMFNTIRNMLDSTSSNVAYGIENAGALNSAITDNVIYCSRDQASYTGILLDGPSLTQFHTTKQPQLSGLVVSRNRIRMNRNGDAIKGRGIQISRVINSIISYNVMDTLPGYGLYLDSAANNDVSHNYSWTTAGQNIYSYNGTTQNKINFNISEGTGVILFSDATTTGNYCGWNSSNNTGGSVTYEVNGATGNLALYNQAGPMFLKNTSAPALEIAGFGNGSTVIEGSQVYARNTVTRALTNWNIAAVKMYVDADFQATGYVQFNGYGSGTKTGTPAYYVAFDASGNIIESTGTSGSTAWSSITGKPTTKAGYGITDVPTLAGTDVLTSKRYVPRVTGTTSSATPAINTDNLDVYRLTAQAANITSMTTNLTGTPIDGEVLEIQITGTGSFTITWGTGFVSGPATLPTAITTTTLTINFQYYANSSYANNKWICISTY